MQQLSSVNLERLNPALDPGASFFRVTPETVINSLGSDAGGSSLSMSLFASHFSSRVLSRG